MEPGWLSKLWDPITGCGEKKVKVKASDEY
jgi:hypothetical protein